MQCPGLPPQGRLQLQTQPTSYLLSPGQVSPTSRRVFLLEEMLLGKAKRKKIRRNPPKRFLAPQNLRQKGLHQRTETGVRKGLGQPRPREVPALRCPCPVKYPRFAKQEARSAGLRQDQGRGTRAEHTQTRRLKPPGSRVDVVTSLHQIALRRAGT